MTKRLTEEQVIGFLKHLGARERPKDPCRELVINEKYHTKDVKNFIAQAFQAAAAT